MKISNYLNTTDIWLDIEFTDKADVLHFIADNLKKQGLVSHANGLYEKLEQREQTMSTGIGNGIGLPHAVFHEVTVPRILIIRPQAPVDFDALDHEPVSIIISLILPENQTHLHVQMLAAVSRLCKNDQFMKCLQKETNVHQLLNNINDIESKMAFH